MIAAATAAMRSPIVLKTAPTTEARPAAIPSITVPIQPKLLISAIYFWQFVQDANIAMDMTLLQSKSVTSVLNLKGYHPLTVGKKPVLLSMA